MRDALGIEPDDARPLTVTGGLPYHGGAGSDYLTHAIAHMVRVLRADPGSFGLVTGVGMHMTKHVAGVYSTQPGPVTIASPGPAPATTPIVDRYEGPATVATYSVVHSKLGPEWALVICDVPGGRCNGRVEAVDLVADASSNEWVGRTVALRSDPDRDGVNLVVA